MLDFNKINNSDGFGTVTPQELDSLLKSLQSGNYNAQPSTLTNGTALQVESLDASLRSTTFSEKTLKLWPIIPKDRAYNTYEEYNRRTSFGESQNGGFFDADSGAQPDEETAAYNRQGQNIKYIGTTRIVSHPLTLVRNAHGPVIAQEIKSGTQWIIQQVERQLFEANGFFEEGASGNFTGAVADIPTSSIKFNGLEQQIRSGNNDSKAKYTGWEGYGDTQSVVYDIRGAVPNEDNIEESCLRSLENFGTPSHLIVPPRVHKDLSVAFYPKERVNPMGVADGKAGFVLTEFYSSAGIIKIMGDKFLNPKQFSLSAAQTGAPATPATPTAAAEADATSQLAASTYYYTVSALNNKGESLASAEVAQAATAGQRVAITIAGVAGATYYAVFRSEVSGSNYQFIGYVKDTNPLGGAGAVFRDAGRRLPGLATGYLLQVESDSLGWKQLAPMMKMDLAIIGTAMRWMQFIYGTPIVYTPLKNVLMDNIGKNS